MPFYPIYGLLGRTQKSEGQSFLGLDIDHLGNDVRFFVDDKDSKAQACLFFPTRDAVQLAHGLLRHARETRVIKEDVVSTKLATAEAFLKEALELMRAESVTHRAVKSS
jgi:hypothetical protein